MKTTFDLPDTLYRQVKIRAAERSKTVREIVIESLQRELAESARADTANVTETNGLFRIDEAGWPVLNRDKDANVRVTDEYVNRLRELEGI